MESKYIGIITNINKKNNSLVISDLQYDIHSIPVGLPVNIGFTEKFTVKYYVEDYLRNNNNSILKIKGVDSFEDANKLKEQAIYIDDILLKKCKIKGDYNFLVGYSAINDETGEKMGIVLEIWYLPANDVLVVETEKGELPVPIIDETIIKINKKLKQINIKLIDGLEELIS